MYALMLLSRNTIQPRVFCEYLNLSSQNLNLSPQPTFHEVTEFIISSQNFNVFNLFTFLKTSMSSVFTFSKASMSSIFYIYKTSMSYVFYISKTSMSSVFYIYKTSMSFVFYISKTSMSSIFFFYLQDFNVFSLLPRFQCL